MYFVQELHLDSLDRLVAELAARQHGVIERSQVQRLGASKGVITYRLASGRWERLHPHVFRLAGSPETWLQELLAACFAWGDGVAISHRSAAGLRGIAGFASSNTVVLANSNIVGLASSNIVELTVPPGRRRRDGPGTVHRNLLLPSEIEFVHGIPTTSVARTLIDLATVSDVGLVAKGLDDALRKRIVSRAWLRWCLTQVPQGRPGIRVIRALLDEREDSGGALQSPFETEFFQALIAEKLPLPVVQHEVHHKGRVIARVDFAYPDARLAVETDGYRYHSIYTDWERDRVRHNDLVAAGWRVIRITWKQLHNNPAATMRRVGYELKR